MIFFSDMQHDQNICLELCVDDCTFSRPLKKTQSEDLGPLEEDELHDLDTLKEKHISPLVLSLLKRNAQYTLDTDEVDEQVGCVLLQVQEDEKRPQLIGYWSQTLTEHERNLDTTQRISLSSLGYSVTTPIFGRR